MRSSRVLGVVLVVVAVGAGRSYPGPGNPDGACSLVTREEASTALGAPVPAGSEKAMKLPLQGATIDAQYCFYGSEVIVARFELGANAPATFGQYRRSLATEEGYRSLDGVGDEAFIAKGQLAARRGQTGLIIDVGQARGGGAKEEAAEKTLALGAIARM